MSSDREAERIAFLQSAGLGGTRTKRFAMVLNNGTVEQIEVEPDSFGASCSLAPSLLTKL